MIEKSREQGWTEVADQVRERAVGASSRGLPVEDEILWEELKEEAPYLFVDQVEGFKLGKMIAEGGQACIYDASADGWGIPLVAKVFKMDGFSLVGLHRHWPRRKTSSSSSEHFSSGLDLVQSFIASVLSSSGDLFNGSSKSFLIPKENGMSFGPLPGRKSLPTKKMGGSLDYVLDGLKSPIAYRKGGLIIDNKKFFIYCLCRVLCGFFLEDGNFVFLMEKYAGDLRTLIDVRMAKKKNEGPPFSDEETRWIITAIAIGMGTLHSNGVLHRDLKAANVLYKYEKNGSVDRITCKVADYESAMFTQGTGFWRAPEVLENLLIKNSCDRNEEIWTEKVDVYSFAMTCYEVMTGHIPFNGFRKSDWKSIIDGKRPRLPDYVDPTLAELVEKCWHKESSQRPTFVAIIDSLVSTLDLPTSLSSAASAAEVYS